MKTGVYCVRNTVTGDMYIGSTANSFSSRWSSHRSALRYGTGSELLQRQWDEYGEAAFAFDVLEACEPEMTRLREAQLVLELKPTLNKGAVYNQAIQKNPETVERLAAARRGKKASEQTRQRMSTTQKARGKRSPEVVANMTKARQARMKKYMVRGEELTTKEIFEKYGVNRDVFDARQRVMGWSIERAATTPPNPLGTNQHSK